MLRTSSKPNAPGSGGSLFVEFEGGIYLASQVMFETYIYRVCRSG